MLEFNIAPNTQVGRIVIPEKVYNHENTYHIDEERYSRGGEFVENMVTDNIIEYCKRWFHLAGVEEFVEDIDEFYDSYEFGNFSNLSSAGFKESPILPTADVIETPVMFTGSKVENPILFYSSKPKDMTYDNIIGGRQCYQ